MEGVDSDRMVELSREVNILHGHIMAIEDRLDRFFHKDKSDEKGSVNKEYIKEHKPSSTTGFRPDGI